MKNQKLRIIDWQVVRVQECRRGERRPAQKVSSRRMNEGAREASLSVPPRRVRESSLYSTGQQHFCLHEPIVHVKESLLSSASDPLKPFSGLQRGRVN